MARVISQQNTDGFAKAGLMLRETLDPGSPHVLASVTPSNGLCFQDRATKAGASAYIPGPSAAVPYWLKLERLSSTFNSFASADGTNWSLFTSFSIPMSATIYAGLALTSHNNSLLSTAMFDNVRVVRYTPPAPPLLTISSSTNGQVQLSIAGSIGSTYACDTSSNLVNWVPFSTNLNSTGTLQIQPPQPKPGGWGFFRARLLP